MNFNLLIAALISGGLVLLAFFQISNTVGVNRKANWVFGIFCLLWASFFLDEVIGEYFFESHFWVWFTLKSAQFFIGTVFFMSVRYYANPDFKFSQIDLLMLIAPVIFITLLLNRFTMNETTYSVCFLVMFLGHSITYMTLSYVTVLKHQKTIETFSSFTEAIDLRWIKYIIYSIIMTLVVITVYNIFRMRQPLNIYVNFHFLVVVYVVAFYSIRQKEIFPRGLVLASQGPDLSASENIPAKGKQLLDGNTLEEIKSRLLNVMVSDELYLDSELNLLKLADKMQLSTHQLSFVINNGIGDNFFNFINGYRVKKSEELLADPNNDNLTIVAIGFESGFNSKTAFNTTFKKTTSLTPTEFRKLRSPLHKTQIAH